MFYPRALHPGKIVSFYFNVSVFIILDVSKHYSQVRSYMS